ncbi:MAG: Ig-like domain-containing protein [Patescibacteria group bacterium]
MGSANNKTKLPVVILFVSIIFIAVLGYSIADIDNNVAISPASNLAQSLPQSGPDGYFDIAVIDALYGTSALGQRNFDRDVLGVINLISTTSPFKERKSQLKVNKVFTGLNFNCVALATTTIGCDLTQVTAELANRGIKYDKAILLTNSKGSGHASLNATITRITRTNLNLSLHELGHMLGLYDEGRVYKSNAPWQGTDANIYSGTLPSSTWVNQGIAAQYTRGCLYRDTYCALPMSVMRSLNKQYLYYSPPGEYVINQKLDAIAGPSPTPFVRLTTNKTIVKKGGSLNMGWFTFGATSCIASGEWTGDKPTHGYITVTLTQPGTYVYTISCMGGGITLSRSVSLIADDIPPIVDAPTVAPINSTGQLERSVTISAVASDNVGLASVSFYVDGRRAATDTKPPYAIGWNTKKIINGPHTLEAVATDLAGHMSTSSPTFVNVLNINAPPSVDAGADKVVAQTGPVSLVAKIIDDALPYPYKLIVRWKLLTGPGAVKFNTTTKSAVTATLSLFGTYNFQIVVYDRQYYATDTISVLVDKDAFATPTSSSTTLTPEVPKIIKNSPTSFTLTTIGSAISISWSKVSGPGEVTFSRPDSFFTDVTVDTSGEYVIRRTVTLMGRKSIDTDFKIVADE